MLYDWLKIIHVISASVLFGTGIGTAFYMLYVNFKKDVALIAIATQQVVFADWLFTGSSGVLQAITGLSMVYVKGYALSTFWVAGSIIGYLIAAVCWFPVVWLQIKCRDMAVIAKVQNTALPRKYFWYFRMWWLLGIPAFLALIVVYYLMSNKIVLPMR